MPSLTWEPRLLFDDDPDAGGGGLTDADIVPGDDAQGEVSSDDTEPAGDPPSGGDDGGSSQQTDGEPEDPYGYIFEAAREAGYDLRTKYKTGKDALNGLLNAQRLIGRRDQDAELGRRLKPYYSEIEEYISQKLSPAAKPDDGQGKTRAPYEIPQLPPGVMRYVGRDENGQLAVGENAPPEIRNAFQEWMRAREDFSWGITTDPQGTLINPLREQLRQEIRQEVLGEVMGTIEQRESQARAEAVNRQILAEVSPWLWEKDANGNRLMGYDSNGNEAPIYTPKGHQYAQAMHTLAQGGMRDVTLMHKTAMQMIGGAPGGDGTKTSTPATQKVAPGEKARPSRTAKPTDSPKAEAQQSLWEICLGDGVPVDKPGFMSEE